MKHPTGILVLTHTSSKLSLPLQCQQTHKWDLTTSENNSHKQKSPEIWAIPWSTVMGPDAL